MDFCTLASGSGGNASLVRSGGTAVLLDAGISARRITTALRQLGTDPGELAGVLITHEHSDHISGLTTLAKQLDFPVYATEPTIRAICARISSLGERCRAVKPGESFQIGALRGEAFPTSHDAACSVGYSIFGDGCRVVLATDLGYLTPEVKQAACRCDLLVCEANHDEDWLRDGPYPYSLKQRVLGDRGHLSNETGAELALLAARAGARTVILAHLSSENNTPARAREVVARRLSAAGIDPEGDVALIVAPRKECGPLFCLSRSREPQSLAGEREAALC